MPHLCEGTEHLRPYPQAAEAESAAADYGHAITVTTAAVDVTDASAQVLVTEAVQSALKHTRSCTVLSCTLSCALPHSKAGPHDPSAHTLSSHAPLHSFAVESPIGSVPCYRDAAATASQEDAFKNHIALHNSLRLAVLNAGIAERGDVFDPSNRYAPFMCGDI